MSYEDEVLRACEGAAVVSVYISQRDEVDTSHILERLQKNRITVVVPVCSETKGEMKMSRFVSFDECEGGRFGILQPKTLDIVNKEDIDIFVVPGTLFDHEGNRKGHGHGYYDRYLADVKGVKKIIGLCFERQVVEGFEPNEWDVPVDTIIIASDKKT